MSKQQANLCPSNCSGSALLCHHWSVSRGCVQTLSSWNGKFPVFAWHRVCIVCESILLTFVCDEQWHREVQLLFLSSAIIAIVHLLIIFKFGLYTRGNISCWPYADGFNSKDKIKYDLSEELVHHLLLSQTCALTQTNSNSHSSLPLPYTHTSIASPLISSFVLPVPWTPVKLKAGHTGIPGTGTQTPHLGMEWPLVNLNTSVGKKKACRERERQREGQRQSSAFHSWNPYTNPHVFLFAIAEKFPYYFISFQIECTRDLASRD